MSRGSFDGFTLSAGQRARNSYLANKRWKENNKDRCRVMNAAQARKWREEHPEKVRELLQAWYAKNKDSVLAKKKEYYQQNKELLKEKSRVRYKNKQEARKNFIQCFSCESLITPGTLYCNWCLNTYTPMKLLGKRVLLRKLDEKQGHIIVLNENPPFYSGIVVAAGNETAIEVGSKVLVGAPGAQEVEWEGEKLLMYLEEDLIGIEGL